MARDIVSNLYFYEQSCTVSFRDYFNWWCWRTPAFLLFTTYNFRSSSRSLSRSPASVHSLILRRQVLCSGTYSILLFFGVFGASAIKQSCLFSFGFAVLSALSGTRHPWGFLQFQAAAILDFSFCHWWFGRFFMFARTCHFHAVIAASKDLSRPNVQLIGQFNNPTTNTHSIFTATRRWASCKACWLGHALSGM